MPQRRTVTREDASITSQGYSMTFFTVDESPHPSYPVKIYIPPGCVLDMPPHYHFTHDEVFHVERGQVRITQNGVPKMYDASSSEVTISRGTIHSIHIEAPRDEPVIAWEKTNPGDDEKVLMFRVMNSTLMDSPTYHKTGKPGLGDILQMNLSYYSYDTYLAFLPVWTGGMGKTIDLVLEGIVAWLASLLGYKATYPEYVTSELYDAVHTNQKAL